MTNEQEQAAIAYFEKLPNRKKVEMLAELSKPFIEKGAITHNAATIQEILELREKCKEAKRDFRKATLPGTNISFGNSSITPPKKKRKK